jgi:hypothetical protein
VIVLLLPATAAAETVTTKCAGEEFGKPYEMTMIYEGGDSGTMTITGSFGEMSLPGAKTQREGVNADGDKVSATEIWASGEVPLIVPEKAAIESCIKGKLTPEQVTDSDIVFSTIGSCAAASPPTAQPIPIKVYAEIGILDPQTIFVTFKRTYLEKTDLPDGTMTLEPLPPPRCTAQ